MAKTLNSIDGITCNSVQGAMYAFPRVSIQALIKRSYPP